MTLRLAEWNIFYPLVFCFKISVIGNHAGDRIEFRPMKRLSGDPEHSSENTRRSRNLSRFFCIQQKKDESDALRSTLGQGLAGQASERLSPGNEPYY